MDLIKTAPKKLFFRYLAAAFGSAFIVSVYGIVDMIVIGKYHGPLGAAAYAVIAPFWNIVYSIGLLIGVGASVLYSNKVGEGDRKEAGGYYTIGMILYAAAAVILTFVFNIFEDQWLKIFGANAETLPLVEKYYHWIKMFIPCFVATQVLAAFLRNDNDPGLATAAVFVGGIFNIFGDYFFTFTLNMGISGAGIATCMGSVLSVVIMLVHFFKKGNALKLCRSKQVIHKIGKIIVSGFSTFIVDISMGILTIVFNQQILRFMGNDALAVYAVIVNLSTFVQCCAYSAGEAAQPIISVNYGAKQGDRVRKTLQYGLYTVAFFSLFWTGLFFLIPNTMVSAFMTPDENVLKIAPVILRTYGVSFLLMPLNVFSTFYFQSVMKPRISIIVSLARGAVISCMCLLLFPLLFAPSSLWWAMPVTEALTAIYVVIEIRKSIHDLPMKA